MNRPLGRVAPGFAIALAVIAGTAAGVTTPAATPSDGLASALLCVSLALAAGRGTSGRALLLAALVCAAAAHGALARERAIARPLLRWFDAVAGPGDRAGDIVAIDGYLRADAALVEGGVRLIVDVAAVRTAASDWTRAPGRVQAHVAGALAAGQASSWTAGRRIRAPVLLRRPAVALNPGGPNLLWQAVRRPFDLTGTIKSAALVEIERGAWPAEWAAGARRFVRAAIAHHVPVTSPDAAAIVTAILIGDRAGLSENAQRRLQVAGTYHVIAISGGNVALVTALVFAAMRLLLHSPRMGSFFAIGFVTAYGFVVTGDASVTRAVTAACLYLGCGLVGLAPRSLHVLATTAVLVAIADPIAVIDVGAWLSFGAALGIVLVAGRFTDAMVGRSAAERPGAERVPRRRPVRVAVARALAALLGASIAAELALAPIAASVFSRVGVAGLLLNFVAIPAMALAQLAGMGVVGLSVVWPQVAALTGGVAGWAAETLVGSAGLVDWLPGLSWRVPPPPLIWIGVYYAAAAVALVPTLRSTVRRAARVILAIALIVVVTAPGTARQSPGAGRLRIAMLDVGQGEAILVQFPSGQSLLIDAGGGAGAFDIGDRLVTPAAWALGVRRLTWLLVTHGDVDHVGGASAVVTALAPSEIWEGVPVPPQTELAALRAEAAVRGTVWRRVQVGESFEIAGVVVDVLHPPRPEWERQRVRNDDSVVVRLRYGAVAFVLTGDAGVEFERGSFAETEAAPLRVLKVGHHGSRTSTSADFVARFRPQIALISAGRGNLFGHPAPDVVRRLDAAGAEIFRTDRDGAVILETDGDSIEVRTIGGRSWRLGLWKLLT